MSPENQGVFQLLKEVTFRRILAFYSSRKWGYFWWCIVTVQQLPFCADSFGVTGVLYRRVIEDLTNPTSPLVPSPGLISQVTGIG